MAVFDINVALGRFANPVGGSFDTPEDLLREMDRLGIDQALVYHAVAAEADVQAGNRLLTQALAGQSRLYPSWVMVPPYLQDVPQPAAWIHDAREAGVRAVRFLPRYHLYSPALLHELLAELNRHGLVAILDFAAKHWSERAIPWNEVRQLANQVRSLPLVVSGATVGDVREIDATLVQTPNVYFDLSYLNPPDVLQQFGHTVHLRRLLFGTGMPRRAGECVTGMVRASGDSTDAMRLVCGGNAARLFDMELPPPAEVDAARHILPSLRPVIDMHAHCGSWERTTTPLKSAADFVKSMDRCGIDKLVFSSFTAIHGETSIGNREASEWVRAFPDRLYAYGVVNPNYPGEVAGELLQCFEHTSNFVGLKFHCQVHGAQLHDHGYDYALAFAHERNLPVLVHGGGADRWDDVAARYPGARFIMAHACAWDGRDPAGRDLYKRARDTENVFVDVSGSAAHRGAMMALVDLIGAEKILYGSDFPMFDLGFEVGRVLLSELPLEQKRMILAGNALRIFRFPVRAMEAAE